MRISISQNSSSTDTATEPLDSVYAPINFFHLVYSFQASKLIEFKQIPSPLEETVDNCLTQACYIAATKTPKGFLAIGVGATGDFRRSSEIHQFDEWRSEIEKSVDSAIVTALSRGPDTLSSSDARPIIDDARGTLWLRVAYKSTLEHSYEDMVNYQEVVNRIVRTRVSETTPEAFTARVAASSRHLTPAGALCTLAARLPKDNKRRAAALSAIHHDFRREFAIYFQPVLNNIISEMPQTTYDDKKMVAKFVNEELRRFGLVIVCKAREANDVQISNNDVAAILTANTDRLNDDIGVFRLEYQDKDGRARRVRVDEQQDGIKTMDRASRKLPALELRVAPSPHDALFLESSSKVKRSPASETPKDEVQGKSRGR